ncbi:MAG: hypothetical protein KAS32_30065 [Candidatus Peribacteraceae bacterium]|nr:hypothetical protein [Candidatus Peribacteraceae bacterium]
MIYLKCLWYIIRHKYYVLIECFKRRLYIQGLLHDISKLYPSEFKRYAKYSDMFFNKNVDPDVLDEDIKKPIQDEFNLAWHHHQRYNKHHWQYWTIVESGNTIRPIPMPRKYVIEMACDWIGANKVGNNPAKDGKHPVRFYNEMKDKIILHEDSRTILEELIREFE